MMRASAVLLSLSLLSGCDGPPTSVAGEPTFTSTATGPAVNRVVLDRVQDATLDDDSVVVAIRAEAIERLYGGTMVLTYSDSAISVVEVLPGELVSGGKLVTTLGSGQEVAGELAIGFVLSSAEASSVTGTIARIRLSVRGGASGQVAFAEPSYGQESRQRAVIARDGVTLAGVRWFGGTASRVYR